MHVRSLAPWIVIPALATLAPAPAAAQTVTASPGSLSFFYQRTQPIPVPQTILVTSTPAVNTTITVTTSGGNWLFVDRLSGTPPYSLQVFIAPAALTPATYQGSIMITPVGGGTAAVVPVTLLVSDQPLLLANPAALTFTFSMNGPAPADQVINLNSTGTPLGYSVAVAGGAWLTVTSVTGTTPSGVTVRVNPAGLATGTYNGEVTIASAGAGNSPVRVPVTFRVLDEIRISAIPATHAVDHQIGAPNPPDRSIAVTSTGAPIGFTVTATATGGNWLVVNTPAGTTPANVSISINPAGLASGNYAGTVSIAAVGATNSPQTVAVTLRVTNDPLILVNPGSLTFSFQTGGPPAPRQMVLVSNIGAALPVSVATATTSGGAWLSATPVAGTLPVAVLVSVSPGTLVAGTYNGSVTITGTAANSPLSVPVTLVVSALPVLRASRNELTFFHQAGQQTPAAQTVQVTSTGSAYALTMAATTNGGGEWLAVAPTSGNTPASPSITVNPANLAPGFYTGTITITGAGAPAAVAIPVRLIVSPTTSPLLRVPDALSFSFSAGGQLPGNQTLGIGSTGAAINYTVTTTTTTAGVNWLIVAPSTGTSGGPALSVGVNTLGLGEGVYTGVIAISAGGVTNSPQYVPVTLTISALADMVLSPALFSFQAVQGGQAPAVQMLNVSSTGTILSFTAAAATVSGGNWLTVSPGAGLTPASLNVSVSQAGLEPGTYGGTITIAAQQASNSPRIVPVTMTVSRALPNMNLSRDSVSFSFSPGGQAPAAQVVQVSSSGEVINFTAAVATADGRNWLQASPVASGTPVSLSISVNTAGLAPGTYTGTVTLRSPEGAANSPRTINVTLTIASVAMPQVTAFVNAASFQPTAAVPGLLVTLGGTNIGPTQLTSFQLTPQGTVPTTVAGTRILFEDIPAPIIYVSGTQSSAVVPYALAGRRSTRVQVEVNGVRSNALDLNVADAGPGIFTLTASGAGNGAILNQDGSVNGPANPAARDSIIVVYLTGEGATNPAGADGTVPGAAGVPLKRPVLPVRARIGGQDAEVIYAGSAPGIVSGVMQVNLRVGAGVTPGPAVPIEITVGSVTSQFGVTVAIR